MQRWFLAVLLASVVLGLMGCEDESAPNLKPKADAPVVQPSPVEATPTPPKPPSPLPADAGGSVPPKQADSAPPPSPPPEAPSAPMPPPPTAQAASTIQLSTGVALPQATVEGTVMGFSVIYEYGPGEPSTEGYVWVIERAHGAASKQKVQLIKKGNLMVLIQGWQPEDGPFKSHIEDAKGNSLSESIEML
jgi:hypothetical protein